MTMSRRGTRCALPKAVSLYAPLIREAFFFGSPPGTMYLSADMCTFVIAIDITIITTLATLSLEPRLVDYAN